MVTSQPWTLPARIPGCSNPQPPSFLANTFPTISSHLQHRQPSRRAYYSSLCKAEICFLCLELILILPDCPLPVLANTNHFCLSSLAVIFPCHCRSCRVLPVTATALPPPLHMQATFPPLLPLWLHPPAVVTLLSSRLNQAPAYHGFGIGTRAAPWQPMVPKRGGAPRAARGRNEAQWSRRQESGACVASAGTKARAGLST